MKPAPLKQPSVTRQVAVACAVAFLMLLVIGLAAVQATIEQAETARRAARTADALLRLELLASAVKDAERGERGYILTGDPQFRQPFDQASAVIDSTVVELYAYVGPSRHRQIDTLRSRVDELMAAFERAMQLRDRRGLYASANEVQEGSLTQETEELLALIDHMRQTERLRLKTYSDAAEHEARWEFVTTVAGILFALLVTGLGAFMLVRDIQARVRAEQALKGTERRFSAAFHNTPVAGAISTLETGKYVDVNESFLRITGYPRSEVIGHTGTDLGLAINPILHQDLHDLLLREGRYQAQELQIRTKAGDVRDILSFAEVIEIDDEPHVHTMFHDITARKRAEAEVHRLNEELEARIRERTAELAERNRELEVEIAERARVEEALRQSEQALAAANEDLERRVLERTEELRRANLHLLRSNRELQDFAYVASHDLQEPLRKIHSFADMIKMECEDALTEEGVHYLDRLQGAARRMTLLIQDLLAFSRITTKAAPFRQVDLNAVVEAALSDLEIAIKESAAVVHAGPLPKIQADRLQMEQLFLNLISNAIKFRRDGVPPEIRIDGTVEHLDGAGPVCRIEIRDNGIGFEERYLEKIFAPFQRLHGRDRYPGSGIGLAICRRIVERHEGTITARSIPGEGTTFIVRLPVHHAVIAERDEAELVA